MKQIIQDIISYENTRIIPESLEKLYEKFKEESLRIVTSKISGFIFRKSFPKELLSKLPPLILSEKSGTKALVQNMLEMNSDLRSVFSINEKNELEFSKLLTEEEKKEIITYVKNNLELDDIIPERRC